MADQDAADAPQAGPPVLSLSESERALVERLRAQDGDWVDEASLFADVRLAEDVARGSLQRLRSKRLVAVDERHESRPALTPRGEEARRSGLPERRLLAALAERGGRVDPDALSSLGFAPEEGAAAIGQLRRAGRLAADAPLELAGSARDRIAEPLPDEGALAAVEAGRPAVSEAEVARLRRRGLVTIERTTHRRWRLTPEGRRVALATPERPLLGALSPALLASGAWRETGFRPYDARAEVPFLRGSRPHPYLEFLRQVEEILIGLGFEEAEGPLLETEFWNADALNMPQEHPARSIHDVFFVRDVEGQLPPRELLERVAAEHEGRPLPGETRPDSPGWDAPYRTERARHPVMRSQTTAVSARYLARHPVPPFRMYSIDRNFRPDAVDATHHIEFDQCEGILGAEGTSIRDLVGVFRAFAEGLGIRDLKVRPTYFPFTEPSVEGYVRHPRLGWIEVFPGGMFRPEVLHPLGVRVPVAAWGIGITRLALVALGMHDIRELYLDDLSRLTEGG